MNGPATDRRHPGVRALMALLLFQGISAVAGGVALSVRPSGTVLRVPRRAWAWFASFAMGCGLVIFEVVEVSIIGFSVLQVLYGAIGAAIAVVTLLPSVQRYCGVHGLGDG